ncbi:MAG: hypothetical protein ABI406_01515 [Ktedonobacteraceae bacterium]
MLRLPMKIRWIKSFALVALALVAVGLLSAFSLNSSASAKAVSNANASQQLTKPASSFTFNLIPSPGISSCLPKASGSVTITPGSLNDKMVVNVSGLPANTGFDLFIIELPNKPFGVAWYQTDVQTNYAGTGSANVRGIFNVETFSVSLGDNQNPPIAFAPTHQYHVGLWFNDPKVPFKLGCEPGQPNPIVTPFNGEQNAGIQVLNTAEFPDNAGPLSHVAG